MQTKSAARSFVLAEADDLLSSIATAIALDPVPHAYGTAMSRTVDWLSGYAGTIDRAAAAAVAELVWQRLVGPMLTNYLQRHKLRFFDRMIDRAALMLAHFAFVQIVAWSFTCLARALKK